MPGILASMAPKAKRKSKGGNPKAKAAKKELAAIPADSKRLPHMVVFDEWMNFVFYNVCLLNNVNSCVVCVWLHCEL